MTTTMSKHREQTDTDRVVALLERLVENTGEILELLGRRSAMAEASDEALVADVLAREFSPPA